MKKFVVVGLIVLLLMGVVMAFNPAKEAKKVSIPANALKISPNTYYLGKAIDKKSGKVVEGYAFVKYKKSFGKPGTECGNGVCEPGENARNCPVDCGGNSDSSTCYAFISRGAKWRTVEDYIVNPNNADGLDENFIRDNIAYDISKWEDAADGLLDGNSVDILGNEVAGVVDGADTSSPDDKNEVYFGDVAESGAIAVTIVWYTIGPPFAREIVEWDMVFDDYDFDWANCSLSDCTQKMDFENIATHELGHAVGLDDLYDDTCSEETMYGYANYNETKKRTLEAGDIAGVSELYS